MSEFGDRQCASKETGLGKVHEFSRAAVGMCERGSSGGFPSACNITFLTQHTAVGNERDPIPRYSPLLQRCSLDYKSSLCAQSAPSASTLINLSRAMT